MASSGEPTIIKIRRVAMQKLRMALTSLVLLAAVSGITSTAIAQGSSELAGGWIVTSWISEDGEINSEPQRGLYIFTESGNYSIMLVNGDEERAQYEEIFEPTDAEKLGAYDSFIANSGRYRVNGDSLTYEAYMAKNPNYMAGFGPDAANGTTVGFTIADGILTLTESNGSGATLRRPGGGN
jgi:Lipocalin-like domain